MTAHGSWREKVNLQEAIKILEKCIDKMVDQEGSNCDRVTPPAKCRCFLDTLQYFGDKWLIYYNDVTDSTKTAMVTI